MSPSLQLIILAGIALFLIFKLRGLLGTRDGFEGTPKSNFTFDQPSREVPQEEVKEDKDIAEFFASDTDEARVLAAMKKVDPGFMVKDFMDGSANAYEWILSNFGKGNLEELQPYLSEEVYGSFQSGIDDRDPNHCYFVEIERIKGNTISDVKFDERTNEAEITVEFVSDLFSYVKDENDEVVDGDSSNSMSQKEEWTFSRDMGSKNPNWILVATG